jgi:hypothetical protein
LTIEADLNKPGEGKMDLKWKGYIVFRRWQRHLRKSGGTSVGIGGSAKTSGVTLSAGADTSGNAGVGGSGSYGTVSWERLKKFSYTSKKSPWNNTEYLGIKLNGSAGHGAFGRVRGS